MPLPRFPHTFPVLKTERLILRQISKEDTPSVFANFSDPDVASWFFDKPLTDISHTDEFIDRFTNAFNNGSGITWALTFPDEGIYIGSCGFDRINKDDVGELGFDLAKAFWGKGLMSESAAAILAYGFNELGLVRVEGDTDLNNDRARRVFEKLDFQQVKIEDNGIYFALDRDDWMNSSSS